ncbi:MAG: cytochrome c [Paracoccaceae bacterium]
MKKTGITVICGVAIVAAGLAWSKDGVQNAVVKERMALMQSISADAKVLGDMATGKASFDADAASGAIGGLTGNANLITERFEPQEDDPVSEAKPEIWSNWDDFGGKAEGLFKVALMSDVSSLEAVQASMANIGGACKACHSTFRE